MSVTSTVTRVIVPVPVPDCVLPAWKRTFRQGIAPLMSTKALKALWKGLAEYDATLRPGLTVLPLGTDVTAEWPVEAACAIGYCGWKGEGLETVIEVEEFFVRVCFECDELMGEPGSIRYFLNWFDTTHDEEMRIGLMCEINNVLYTREEEKDEPPPF